MPIAPTPSVTTELSAVNTCLAAIGEAPISTLSGQLTGDVLTARAVLNEITVEVQSEEWVFNVEHDFPLVPNEDKEIVVPADIVAILTPSRDFSLDVILRGPKLYDRANHTYTFDQTLTVNIKRLLPFESMPESARRYVSLKAARIFQDRVLGSDQLHDNQSRDELQARARLMREDLQLAKCNILSGGSGGKFTTFIPANVLKGRRR